MKRFLHNAVVVSAGAVLVSCDNAATPEPTLDVAITATAQPIHIIRDATGAPAVSCVVSVQAASTGSTGAVGTWQGGVVRFFAGDRTNPVDSLVVHRITLGNQFGGDSLRSGVAPSANWHFYGRTPFSAEFSFRYRVGDQPVRETNGSLTHCGPDPNHNSITPPQVLIMGTTPADPTEIEYGENTLSLDLILHSPAGLWDARVLVSGAFHDTILIENGSMERRREQRVPISVPRTAQYRGQIIVQVSLTDGLLRRHDLGLSVSPRIVDRTPPQVKHVRLSPSDYDATRLGMTGWYDQTDSVRVDVYASDAHGLAGFHYEVTNGQTGVLPLEWDAPQQIVLFPVRPEWGTNPGFRFRVSDRSGNSTQTFVTPADSVLIFPTSTRPRFARALPGPVIDVAGDASRRRLYIAQPRAVAIYSLPDLNPIGTIPLASDPVSLDLYAGGDSLFVALNAGDELRAFAVGLPGAGRVVDVPRHPAMKIHSVRAMAGGRVLLALRNLETGMAQVSEFTPGVGGLASRTGVRPGEISRQLLKSADGRRAMFIGFPECEVVIDVGVGATPCADVDEFFSFSTNRTGSRFYSQTTLYDRNLQVLRPVPHPDQTEHSAAISPDGEEVWIPGWRGITRVRLSDNRPLERVVMRTVFGQSFFVGSEFLVGIGGATGLGSNAITVVDLR